MSVWLNLRRHTRRRFVLQVPLDAADCAQRLADLTSSSGNSWYLRAKSHGQPDPQLRGRASGDGVYLARWESTLGRNSFGAWLDADLKPSVGRTCLIEGWVGLARSWAFVWPLLSFAFVIICGAMIGAAIGALASGNFVGIAFLLIVAVLVGFAIVLLRTGLRDYRREADELASEIPRLLWRPTGDGD